MDECAKVFYDAKFEKEGGRLYVHLVNGRNLIKYDKASGLFIDTDKLDDLIIFSNYFSFVEASIIFNISNRKIGIQSFDIIGDNILGLLLRKCLFLC